MMTMKMKPERDGVLTALTLPGDERIVFRADAAFDELCLELEGLIEIEEMTEND